MTVETQYQTCPVCSSSIRLWRVRHTKRGSYKIDVCGSCGFAFVNPRPSLSFLMDFYSSIGPGGLFGGEDVPTKESLMAREKADPNSTIDAKRLVATTVDLLKQTATQRGRFLDIGCGFGFFSREAIDSGFEVTALDLAPNKRKVTREITGLDPVECSFEDFQCPPASLSAVLMSQILEHVSDVNLWVSKAHGLLVDNGVLAIALPNYGSVFRRLLQEKSPYITPPEHLNFFNPRSLSTLLEKHGFKVERVQWVSRVPKWILKKRLPKAASPLLPVADMMVSLSLGVFDALHLGLMINVYARKVGQRPPARPEVPAPGS